MPKDNQIINATVTTKNSFFWFQLPCYFLSLCCCFICIHGVRLKINSIIHLFLVKLIQILYRNISLTLVIKITKSQVFNKHPLYVCQLGKIIRKHHLTRTQVSMKFRGSNSGGMGKLVKVRRVPKICELKSCTKPLTYILTRLQITMLTHFLKLKKFR